MPTESAAMPVTPAPRISIVTPSFNGEMYLRSMLDSIQSQTWPHWEHIVVDNCSTDGTLRILRECADPRRVVVSEPDRGQSNALNKGFARATGDVLCWLNVDDEYASPQALQAVAQAFAGNGPDVLYGDVFWRYEPEGRLQPVWLDTDAGNLPQRFLRHMGVCQPGVFWRRRAWDRAGPLDEDLHYAMDFALWCRLALTGQRWEYLPQPLAVHRVHADMKTVKQRGRSLFESLLVILSHLGQAPAPWIERVVTFYREGRLGLGDAARPDAMALSESEARLLARVVQEATGTGDPLALRMTLGLLAPALAPGLQHPLRTALEDLLHVASSGFDHGQMLARHMAEVETALQAAQWRAWPAAAGVATATATPAAPVPEPATGLPAPGAAAFPAQAAPAAAARAAAPRTMQVTGAFAGFTPESAEMRFDRLLRFRDRFAGRECIVMCNGPSLRDVDFSRLQDHFLIGLNKIYLGSDLIGRLPDLVVCVNKKVLEQSAERFAAMRTLKFLGSRAGALVPPDPMTFYFNSNAPGTPRFSTDIVRAVHEGWTVTHAALQVAYYLGFRKIVIVGMDHNFPSAAGKPNEEQRMHGADLNHFAPNYFGFGQQWDLPDLGNSEISYAEARRVYEADGRVVIDATEKGHCRVFQRMTLAQALVHPIPQRTGALA